MRTRREPRGAGQSFFSGCPPVVLPIYPAQLKPAETEAKETVQLRDPPPRMGCKQMGSAAGRGCEGALSDGDS